MLVHLNFSHVATHHDIGVTAVWLHAVCFWIEQMEKWAFYKLAWQSYYNPDFMPIAKTFSIVIK